MLRSGWFLAAFCPAKRTGGIGAIFPSQMSGTKPPPAQPRQSWEGLLNARMNQYYHQKLRTRWSRIDVSCKVVAGVLSLVSSFSLAGLPGWVSWAGVGAFAIVGLLVVLRVDRKLETHTSLACRYLGHAQTFERIFKSGDYSELQSAAQAYEQTERYEAEQEGQGKQWLLEQAQSRVLAELGAPT